MTEVVNGCPKDEYDVRKREQNIGYGQALSKPEALITGTIRELETQLEEERNPQPPITSENE